MSHISRKVRWSILWLCGLVVLMVIIAGCGGATTSAGNSTSSGSANSANIPPGVSSNNQGSSSQSKNSSSGGVQRYLIKTLNISMQVKDTQKVAADLQTWISATDPLSTATNIQYDPVGDNLYNVTMTFSVQASLYPRIEGYLNAYPGQHGGQLLSTNKTTQDVTSDYVDTQSRLQNLRAEQSRLLTLMSHATALGDILSIDQRLTDVEGQIEQIEAHLKNLDEQTTFYNITVSLQPGTTAVNPPPAVWSLAQIWQSALGAALAFGQVLLTVLVWLAVFSVYIVPSVALVWFVRRWWRIRRERMLSASSIPQVKP